MPLDVPPRYTPGYALPRACPGTCRERWHQANWLHSWSGHVGPHLQHHGLLLAVLRILHGRLLDHTHQHIHKDQGLPKTNHEPSTRCVLLLCGVHASQRDHQGGHPVYGSIAECVENSTSRERHINEEEAIRAVDTGISRATQANSSRRTRCASTAGGDECACHDAMHLVDPCGEGPGVDDVEHVLEEGVILPCKAPVRRQHTATQASQ